MPKPQAFSSGFGNAFGHAKNCEIVCYIDFGKNSSYEDGDILQAYTEHKALLMNGQKICHVKKNNEMTGSGNSNKNRFHLYGSLPWLEQETIYQYKFTRISANEVEKENIDPSSPAFGFTEIIRNPLYEVFIAGGQVRQYHRDTRFEALEQYIIDEDLSSSHHVENNVIVTSSNGQIASGFRADVLSGESMIVELFFRRRLQNENHRVFKDQFGRFVYFGGRQDFSENNVHSFWDKIETKTGKLRKDHLRVRHSPWVFRSRLVLPVENISHDQATELTLQLLDETNPQNVIRVKRRKYRIDFDNLNEIDNSIKADIRNINKPVNLRDVVRINANVRKILKNA